MTMRSVSSSFSMCVLDITNRLSALSVSVCFPHSSFSMPMLCSALMQQHNQAMDDMKASYDARIDNLTAQAAMNQQDRNNTESSLLGVSCVSGNILVLVCSYS